MPPSPVLKVKNISFSTIKEYWIEVEHFAEPNKIYVQIPRTLGHLYAEERLIGVTQLIEWAPGVVRYRTINIREEYRGKDLGYYLLKTALAEDWSSFQYLFGWVRKSHYEWSLRHGFREFDGIWSNDHIAMIKSL
jgi:N-acetylglutamate synthase-like GNAT family acetyltransferase